MTATQTARMTFEVQPTAMTGKPSASLPFGTITVVDATPPSPWYQRTEVTGLLAPVGALVLAILAAWLALRNGLRLQAESKRNEFRLEVYREFAAVLDKAEDCLSAASVYVLSAATAADLAEQTRGLGVHPAPLRSGGEEFSEIYHQAASRVIEVIRAIERYIILEPELDVFRLALSAGLHDCTELHNNLVPMFSAWFPLKRPEGSNTGPEIVNVKPIPRPVIQTFGEKGSEFYAKINTVSSYLGDLRRELQVLLLSGLFAGHVPKRQPLDPEMRVVSLDKHQLPLLRKHFGEETAWGKRTSEVQLGMKEHFAKKKPASS